MAGTGLTLLKLVQKAAALVPTTVPTSLFSSGTDISATWIALAWQVIEDIKSRDTQWQGIVKETVINSIALEDQGNIKTLIPDFHRWIYGTEYERSLHVKMIGPLSPAAWQNAKAGVVSPFIPTYRIKDDHLLILNNATAGL